MRATELELDFNCQGGKKPEAIFDEPEVPSATGSHGSRER